MIYTISPEKLSERLSCKLPGITSHLKMVPLKRLETLQSSGDHMQPVISSVLVLLYPLEGVLHTMLIKRTPDKGVHSGQISFPGGKKDNEDLTIVDTALREAREELGIMTEKVLVLGELSPLYVAPSNFTIYPVVGYMESIGMLRPNSAEVEFVIETPLADLPLTFTKSNISVRGFELKQVPCFLLNGQIIWGATAMILHELLDVMDEL